MKILVDGDACPVKEEISKIALAYKVDFLIFISLAHWSDTKTGVDYITVDSNCQEVDMVLINQVKEGDIVITNDYGLVALVLGKRAHAISFGGKVFSKDRVNYLLESRHFLAKLRRRGIYLSKPSKYTKEDRDEFVYNLSELIEKLS